MPETIRSVSWSSRLRQFALLVCFTVMPATVASAEIKLDFSGFGTLAGVKTDEDTAKLRLLLNQGEGASSDIDWGLRSSLGAQVTADFGEQFSLTAQAVAKRRGQDDMDPDLEWLYASYRPVSWFDIRAGRLVMPELLISDYRQVGYSQPTVTPPLLAYIWASVESFEGAQLYNRIPLGEGLLTLQTSFGEGSETGWTATEPLVIGPVTNPNHFDLDFNDIRAFNVTYEWGDWLIRAVQLDQEIDVKVQPSSVFDQTFKGYALQYDDGRLLVMAESIDRESAAKAQYVLLGWRFGRWLPSVTVSQSKVVSLIGQWTDYDSTMFALRYDFTDNMALKLQWEEMPADYVQGPGTQWLDTYPGFSGDRDVISFGLDFIF